MTDFPLCKSLGLTVHKEVGFVSVRKTPVEEVFYIYASDLEKVLASALRVKGICHEGKLGGYMWAWTLDESKATHEAILLRPQPIKQETAEDLLREFIARHDQVEKARFIGPNKWVERARKLIGK